MAASTRGREAWHDRFMRPLLPLVLIAAFPTPVLAAALEYSCKAEKTVGPVTASTGVAARPDDKTKDAAAPSRFFYDAATEQAAASDAHGQLAPALAVKVAGGVKFITASAVTTISDSGEFHRVETLTIDGRLSTSVGVGRCTVKENRLAGKPFSDR